MEIEKDVNNYPSPHAVYNGENAKNMGKKILKPIRQEKIVKVPVTQYVEKIIEKEEIKYVNKYVDVIKPIITYKTKHISKPIYLDKIKYETKVLEKEKIVHIPKIEYKNKIVEIPVYVHREKIIEKKVPLIIERVIPVLKVKKHEKCVFTDSVELPEICNMIQKEKLHKPLKVSSAHVREESSYKVAVNQPLNISSAKISNEEDPSNMKTYRTNHKSDVEEIVAENTYTSGNKQGKKFVSNSSSSASSTDDVEDVHAKEPLREKRNTEYVENINEDTNVNDAVEEVQEMAGSNVNEHLEEEKTSAAEEHYVNREDDGEEGYYKHAEEAEEEQFKREEVQYCTSGDNTQYNTTRVSVHLAEPVNENGIYEQNYVSVPENNSNMMYSNNQMYMNNNDVYYGNGQKFLRPNVEGNQVFSEQAINHSAVHIDPKLYSSMPVRGHFPESIQEMTKEQIELDQSYVLTNMNPITREHYNSTHNVHSTKATATPSKQSFRPSYANSNGQAIVSVRPATIVEYKPKTRKTRAPMCNFLNKCCGGNVQE